MGTSVFQLIEHISYQILIVLLSFIIYHLFIREEKQDREKIFSKFMFISLISLILIMAHPIEFSEGYLYDFRVIPVLFMFLYGGVRPALLLVVIMISYRCLLGGSGIFITIFNYTIATGIFFLLKRKIELLALKQKIVIISILYWLITLSRSIFLLSVDKFEQFSFQLLFSFLSWITLIILMFIIDNLDKQIIFYQHIKNAERLNLVSQIAASVAHEVRNPMTSIKGFLQLIKEDQNLTTRQEKYLDISLSELQRAEDVIHDYLSLAKPTTPEVMTELNVTAELHSMIDIMSSYTNTRNISIEASIEQGILTKGKKNEFKQALLNIMKNSVEAINTNGTLSVSASQHQQKILIEIKDNGVGMTKKQLEKLGAPYYSTKDKGTGVGLTITYKIIRDMKGKISVESEADVGTTFSIELPSLERTETVSIDQPFVRKEISY